MAPPVAALHFSFDSQSGPVPNPAATLDDFLSSSPLSVLGVLSVKDITAASDSLPALPAKPELLRRKMEELAGRRFRVSHVSGDDELKVFVK